jgi:hypothetical protein
MDRLVIEQIKVLIEYGVCGYHSIVLHKNKEIPWHIKFRPQQKSGTSI